jgi:hypothetical protein
MKNPPPIPKMPERVSTTTAEADTLGDDAANDG